jgi:tetratricopeptide (TPR) repeat protein
LLDDVGDLRGAQTYAQKAIATSEQLLPLKPRDPDLAMSLGSAYELLADLSGNPAYSNLGDTGAALDLYNRCLPYLSAVAANQSDPDAGQPLAGLHIRIGKVYQYALGDYPKALEHFTTAAQISDSIRRRKSNRWTELDAGIRYRFMAAALQSLGRAEARARAAESLAILEAVDRSFPGVPSFQRETDLSITMLGSFDAEAGNHAKAVDQYRRALRIFDSLIATQATYSADFGYATSGACSPIPNWRWETPPPLCKAPTPSSPSTTVCWPSAPTTPTRSKTALWHWNKPPAPRPRLANQRVPGRLTPRRCRSSTRAAPRANSRPSPPPASRVSKKRWPLSEIKRATSGHRPRAAVLPEC